MEIGSKSAGLVQGLKESRTQLNEFGEKMAGVFEAGVLGVSAAKTVEFLKECVTDAANLEQAMLRNHAIFGEASESMAKFAEGMNEKFGSSETQVNEIGFRFGVLFKEMGVGEEKTEKLSEEFTKLADNVAASRGIGFEEAANAIQMGVMGMERGLHRLGVSFTDAEVERKAFDMGLVGVGESLSENDKKMASAALIVDKFKDSMNAHEKQMDTYTQQVAKLGGEFEHLKESIGKVVLPSITAALTQVNQGADTVRKHGFFESIKGSIASVFGMTTQAQGEGFFGMIGNALVKKGVEGLLGTGEKKAPGVAEMLARPKEKPGFRGNFGAFGMLGNLGMQVNEAGAMDDLDMKIRMQKKSMGWQGSHVMDTESFMKQAQDTILKGQDEMQKKQLDELIKAREALDKLVNKADNKGAAGVALVLKGREH